MLHYLLSLLFYVSITYATPCNEITEEKKCIDETGCVWGPPCENGLGITAKHNWDISYETKPNQFKFYDTFDDNTAIIIKLQELTEYKSNTNIKTSHTQAISDVQWNTEHGIYKNIEGKAALTNGFQSSSNIKVNTFLFSSDNSLKFDIHINNWQYLSTENYLALCLQMITTNIEYKDIPSSDTSTFLNGFEISNTKKVLCNNRQINVVPTILNSNDKNTINFCYNIEPCNGNIKWSTKISYDSKKRKHKHSPKPKHNPLPVVKTTNCDFNDIRYRKDWLEMTTDERSLFIEGFGMIRGNMKLDTITESHSVAFMGRLHESSLFLYYHSYIIWETESAIRQLGGKFSCFAMPFYDWTRDYGSESDPKIFHTGLGGDGSADNLCIDNEDGSRTKMKKFRTGSLCYDWETPPNCCLKRFTSKTQKFVPKGKLLTGMKFKNAEDFDAVVRVGHSGFHRFFGDLSTTHMHSGYATDDPLFHLLHSYMDLLRVVWQDCHQYTDDYSQSADTISSAAASDGKLYVTGDMYHDYCYGSTQNTFTERQHATCAVLEEFIHLDDELVFFGLAKADWTIIGHDKKQVTIRNLFNINFNSRWRVMYDVEKFYDKNPGFKKWCSGERNEERSAIWQEIYDIDSETDEIFIYGDVVVDDEEKDDVGGMGVLFGWSDMVYVFSAVVVLLVFVFVAVWKKYGSGWCLRKNGKISLESNTYGAVYAL